MRDNAVKLIGFYNYTVWLTYLSLCSAVAGMMCAGSGRMGWAVACLALSGLLDAFDGKVARSKTDRTEDEKQFGIQLDSLCDIVCFGALPVMICWFLGLRDIPGILILVFYCLAGLIRLAYFNVLEIHRQRVTSENRRYYRGLPITSIAVILPLLFAGAKLMGTHFSLILHGAMLITGVLFITNFRFRKPSCLALAAMILVIGGAVVYTLLCHPGVPVHLP